MFLQFAVPGACWPLFALHLTELAFSYEQIALCCASAALAQLCTPLLFGQIADRWLPAQHCCAACALTAGVLLCMLAELTEPIAVFWVGFAFWLVMVPTMTLGVSICFANLPDPARNYGGVRLWGTVGWMVPGLLLGVWFAEPDSLAWLRFWLHPDDGRTDLTNVFRLAALLAFVLACYALTLPHTPPTRRHEIAVEGRLGASRWLAPLGAFHLLRDRAFAVYCLCALGVCISIPFGVQVTPLLLKSLGIARQELPPLLTIAQSVEAVSLGLLPMIQLRLGVRGTMLLGLGSWGMSLSVQTLGEPDWLVVASLALNGLCICCFLVAGQVYANSRARRDIRASSQALLSFVSGLGQLLGSLLVGVVRNQFDGAFVPTFATAAIVAFASLLIFLIGFPPERVQRPVLASTDPGVLVPAQKMT